MTHAPVALIVYNRPAHTRRTIASLKTNPEFFDSPVFVFCDGPKNAEVATAVADARATAKALLPNAIFVESQANNGLARSIVGATTKLTEEFGRTIIVEDDLLVASDFLAYMNAMLDHYADDPRILQISAYLPDTKRYWGDRILLMPFTTSWGWGTWKRAWRTFELGNTREIQRILDDPLLSRSFDLDGNCRYTKMLRRQLTGRLDSWAVYWYAHVFIRQGLVAFPPSSRVMNAGFDGSGTHGSWRAAPTSAIAPQPLGRPLRFPENVSVDEKTYRQIARAMGRSASLFNVLRNFARSIAHLVMRAGR